MAKIFSYKLSRDYGFAPNPYHGICSLATCKPQIRSSAQIGDLVIGCGSITLGFNECIIFAMRVQAKVDFEEYWRNPAYSMKRVSLVGSKVQSYGDNIYHREGDSWIQEDSHHSFADGVVNELNLGRDTNSPFVLLSSDFVYFGRSALPVPETLRDVGGDDLVPHGRNYRNTFSPEMVELVNGWFDSAPKGVLDMPISW
jgi:hypothetical protein